MHASSLKRPDLLGPGVLILLVLCLHAWFLGSLPNPQYWGDEPMYAQNARLDAQAGETSVLPGQLPFRIQPALSARLLSNLEQGPGLHRSATLLQMGLLALTLAMLYWQARLLKLRPGFALLASGLLGCFPWFGFHVHSLWPEVLHAFFCAAAFLGVLLALARWQVRWLLPAGICIGLALLTKGVMQPFALLFAGVLGFGFWQHARANGEAWPWKPALLAPAILLLGCLGTLAPQLMANEAAGHGYRLAANQWWNMELGLCADPRAGRSVGRLQRAYFEASMDASERESMAKKRTLSFVREQGLWGVFVGQLSKVNRLLFQHDSSFERSLHRMQRWGPDPPALLVGLARLGRGMWFALFSLGLLGFGFLWRRSASWFLVSAFSLGFCLAAFLIPLKVRFLMPLIPFLCLLSAGLLQLLWEQRSAKMSSSPKAAG